MKQYTGIFAVGQNLLVYGIVTHIGEKEVVVISNATRHVFKKENCFDSPKEAVEKFEELRTKTY